MRWQGRAGIKWPIPSAQAQLGVFLQHCALAPEAIAQLLTSVHARSTELLIIGHRDQDHAERVLRRYAQW